MNKNSLKSTNQKSFLKKSKQFMPPDYIDFIFKIFKERYLPPFYCKVKNKFSDTSINLPNEKNTIPLKNKIYVVNDVPGYLDSEIKTKEDSLKLKVVRQYKGFLLNIKDFKKTEQYLNSVLSKRGRKKLRSQKNKLEQDCNIQYCMYYGEISKFTYDHLFDAFKILLKKRFDSKQVYNRNLLKWDYYHKLTYSLILEKKASLFVIYDNEKPINITLNFHVEDMLFSYIQTFDADYSRFNLGDIDILKHVEWCIQNKMTIIDLSKGDFAFKRKWCNHIYDFDYHIFYNSKSFISTFLAHTTAAKLKLKQFLRSKNISKVYQYDKVLFKKDEKNIKITSRKFN